MVKKAFRDKKIDFVLPVEVTLTRIAPKSLDAHDNLPVSLKWIADQTATELTGIKQAGRADDSKEITWKYQQRKGRVREYAVEIAIEEK